MKKRFILAAALIATASTACASPSDGWAARGDKLVRQGNYKAAYAAYISRCNDSSVSISQRMVGCGAARDFRLEAKRRGIDTSDW